MSVVGMVRLTHDIERVPGLIAETKADPLGVLARYRLSDAEVEAILALDADRLVALGLNALPMRNLVTLLGVPNPEIYTHSLSLQSRPAQPKESA